VTDRDEIERGLLLLVEHGGNSLKAAESDGCVWASSTLRKWRQENPELYRRVELAHTNELEDATKARAQEIAHQAGDLEKQLLNKVEEKIGGMDGREAAQAARAVADVRQKAAATWMTLEGRNPEGSRTKDDTWEMIEAGVRSGVLKLAPAAAPNVAGRRAAGTDTDAPDTPTSERGDAGSNVSR
jgi:hypothetical protein